jgi:tricarballylate dehydrogenase
MPPNYDVIVVGAGNAAFCAAHAAREAGARAVMLERAPEGESGGNSRFTAGAIRFAYDGVEDLKAIMPDLTDDEVATTDFGRYTEDQFFEDMACLTQDRADPDLVDILVRQSLGTMKWLNAKGLRSPPSASTIPPWSPRCRCRTRCGRQASCRPVTRRSRCGSRARSIPSLTC